MAIKIYPVRVGIIRTNAYFYIDETTKHGMLIDPGAEADLLLDIMEKQDFHIDKILLTHGHFDHIGAVPKLQETLQVPVYMQENGSSYVENAVWNLSSRFGSDITLQGVNYLKANSIITLQNAPDLKLQLIPTPGHTTDSCIYYDEAHHIAFVGDTVFEGSYGRTDGYGGSEQEIFKSIRENVLTLPKETILLPGHGGTTSVEAEMDRPWYHQ